MIRRLTMAMAITIITASALLAPDSARAQEDPRIRVNAPIRCVYEPPTPSCIEAEAVGHPIVGETGTLSSWAAATNQSLATTEARFPLASAGLADGSVTAAKLADDAVIGRKLAPGSVASGHIVGAAVTTDKIANNAVTGRKVAADAIERGHLQDDAVGTPELVADSITEPKLSAAVRTKLNATGGAGVDQTARDAAAAAASAAATADGKAVTAQNAAAAAQLATDTVIEAGPTFVHNERTARNLNIHLRHPINAYSTATLMSVSVGGQAPIIVGYDHTLLEQWVNAEVSGTVLQNVWDQTKQLSSDQLYVVGTYIPVEIRLLTGRGGDTVFVRVVDVLVVAAPASATDDTARQLARAAQTTANAALPKAGGTLTGGLILDGAPTADLQAATKKYVDDNAYTAPSWTAVTCTTSGNVATCPVGATVQDIAIAYTRRGGVFHEVIPRPLITTTAQQVVFDHRNPGGNTSVLDSASIGASLRFSSRATMTIDSTGWDNAGVTPTVLVR